MTDHKDHLAGGEGRGRDRFERKGPGSRDRGSADQRSRSGYDRSERTGPRPNDGFRRDDRGTLPGRPAQSGGRPERGGKARREGQDGDTERRGGSRLTPKEGRKPEPAIAEDVTGRELERSQREQLRTLSKENAEGVAQHLVMTARLIEEEDFDGALAHAETAARRAGRVPAVRESLGFVHYLRGEWADALREFRTVRRLSGSEHLLPLMVDCERGLGRAERALELASSAAAGALALAERMELAIVISGIRRDLGQPEAAVAGLAALPQFRSTTIRPWTAALFYAYADALLDTGQNEQARHWFERAAAVDEEDRTDAGERLDELDGIQRLPGQDTDGDKGPA